MVFPLFTNRPRVKQLLVNMVDVSWKKAECRIVNWRRNVFPVVCDPLIICSPCILSQFREDALSEENLDYVISDFNQSTSVFRFAPNAGSSTGTISRCFSVTSCSDFVKTFGHQNAAGTGTNGSVIIVVLMKLCPNNTV